jgi:hypothetical protein
MPVAAAFAFAASVKGSVEAMTSACTSVPAIARSESPSFTRTSTLPVPAPV